jgi:cytochrome P450
MVAEQRHDWGADYDIFEQEYIRDPYQIWDELRNSCPVAHSDRWGSSWLPTRFEDVFAIAHDHERFSSRSITVTPVPHEQAAAADYGIRALPISVDPPMHTWSRRLLLPAFNLRSVEKWEPVTRNLCRSLIAGFAHTGPRRRRLGVRSADPGTRDRRHAGHPGGDV